MVMQFFSSFNLDIDTIYKKFNLLKYQDSIKINILKYINIYITKSLPIILQYLFTQNSNMYKPLSKKLVLPKIKHIGNRFASLTNLLIYGMHYRLLFTY